MSLNPSNNHPYLLPSDTPSSASKTTPRPLLSLSTQTLSIPTSPSDEWSPSPSSDRALSFVASPSTELDEQASFSRGASTLVGGAGGGTGASAAVFAQLERIKGVQREIVGLHSSLERVRAGDKEEGGTGSGGWEWWKEGRGAGAGGMGRTKEDKERTGRAYELMKDEFVERQKGVEEIMAKLSELGAELKKFHALPSPVLFPSKTIPPVHNVNKTRAETAPDELGRVAALAGSWDPRKPLYFVSLTALSLVIVTALLVPSRHLPWSAFASTGVAKAQRERLDAERELSRKELGEFVERESERRGLDGYFVMENVEGLGYDQVRDHVVQTLLMANVLHRVAVIPASFAVEKSSCLTSTHECSFLALSETSTHYHLPLTSLLSISHLRSTYPTLTIPEFNLLHSISDPPSPPSLAMTQSPDLSLAPLGPLNIAFLPPEIFTSNLDGEGGSGVLIDEYPEWDKLQFDGEKGGPSGLTRAMVREALGEGDEGEVWKEEEARRRLRAVGWELGEKGGEEERELGAFGWVPVYGFDGSHAVPRTYFAPLPSLAPLSSLLSPYADISVLHSPPLPTGGLKFSSPKARDEFGALVVSGMKANAGIRKVANDLVGRLKEDGRVLGGGVVPAGGSIQETIEKTIDAVTIGLHALTKMEATSPLTSLYLSLPPAGFIPSFRTTLSHPNYETLSSLLSDPGMEKKYASMLAFEPFRREVDVEVLGMADYLVGWKERIGSGEGSGGSLDGTVSDVTGRALEESMERGKGEGCWRVLSGGGK
ncbi:hypothetical protein MNV49_002959 [Pseudohyphozyma bogoriensis]|nr:hypothetical protein MNV49_002959 [Pseudohyphozyma bogoriensis]